MQAMRTEARAIAGHLPAAALRAESAAPVTPILNEALISHAVHGRKKSASRHRGSVPNDDALNAFFVISANSPSMSMVNFSCCVCPAPKSSASGVTRRVAPQPIGVAVRTEAGAHARL
jgi:hypothetical protein